VDLAQHLGDFLELRGKVIGGLDRFGLAGDFVVNSRNRYGELLLLLCEELGGDLLRVVEVEELASLVG